MVFRNVIVDITISSRSFVFSQSRVEVSTVAGGFASSHVRTVRVRTHFSEYGTLTAFAPEYAYYLEYFSFFKREKSVTMLLIRRGELEKGRERTRWVRTRLGAKPASFVFFLIF